MTSTATMPVPSISVRGRDTSGPRLTLVDPVTSVGSHVTTPLRSPRSGGRVPAALGMLAAPVGVVLVCVGSVVFTVASTVARGTVDGIESRRSRARAARTAASTTLRAG